MNFDKLCAIIKTESEQGNFIESSNKIERLIYSISRLDLISLISEIGSIPESIPHDSSAEKLFAKSADILLAKSFQELGLKSTVLRERADCADVVAKSQIHHYSLVGDAKAFRLSRSAKNQKDFKVKSMVDWRGTHNYAVLVCPYYQYPRHKNAIYGQAVEENITLFSWEYLTILLKNQFTETSQKSLLSLWETSAYFAQNRTVANKNLCFLDEQNSLIQSFLAIDKRDWDLFFNEFRLKLTQRGNKEISFWQQEKERIKSLSRDEAIQELLFISKLDKKIDVITKFLRSVQD